MNPYPSTFYSFGASHNDESFDESDDESDDERYYDESCGLESTSIKPSPGYKEASYDSRNGYYSDYSDEEDESFAAKYTGWSPPCKRLRDSDGEASDGCIRREAKRPRAESEEEDGWIDCTEEPEEKPEEEPKAKRPRAESPATFCAEKRIRECTRGEGDGTEDAPFTLSDPPEFSAILDLLEEASKHDRLLRAIPDTLKHVLASSLFYGKEAYDFDESAAGVRAFAKRMAVKWEEFQRNRAIAVENFAAIAKY